MHGEQSTVSDLIDIIFLHTWWRYPTSHATWFDNIYHWFNILEGCAWFVFTFLTLRRFLKNRNSSLELWYSFAFFTFALSDFCEAYMQTSWLIWFKLVNLIMLFLLRRTVMSRYYSHAKLF